MIVVTGAFGYSGRYITQRLLADGHRVRTLTNSPSRENQFAGAVEIHPYSFHNPAALTDSLRGAKALINTYWVRFNHRSFTHAEAVKNTQVMFEAAKRAGVERIVHVSITNPSADSPLEYFRGKALLEQALIETGLSYAILRPAVLFGGEDILINNIAWMLRRFPIFGVFGDGKYRLQPIHVDDLAALAVAQCAIRESVVIDAIGPETFTYRELARTIGTIIGVRRPIISIPPLLGRIVAGMTGFFVGDVVVTPEEIKGLMADLLATDSAPVEGTRLTDWAREHANELGRKYASELARRRHRDIAYTKL